MLTMPLCSGVLANWIGVLSAINILKMVFEVVINSQYHRLRDTSKRLSAAVALYDPDLASYYAVDDTKAQCLAELAYVRQHADEYVYSVLTMLSADIFSRSLKTDLTLEMRNTSVDHPFRGLPKRLWLYAWIVLVLEDSVMVRVSACCTEFCR